MGAQIVGVIRNVVCVDCVVCVNILIFISLHHLRRYYGVMMRRVASTVLLLVEGIHKYVVLVVMKDMAKKFMTGRQLISG